MKVSVFFLAAMFFGALAVSGQVAVPTPPVKSDDDVVRISTSLIQIDVSVTDKKGKIIRDLRQDEIEIYENGKKQDISNFSFISAVQGVTSQTESSRPAPAESGKAPIPVLPTVEPKASSIRRTIALVVDDLTLSFASTQWVKDAVKKYVNEQVQDGDLVAIIRTAGGSGALQQFTTDKRRMLAAADKIQYFILGGGGLSTFDPITRSNQELAGGGKDPNERDLTADIAMHRQKQLEADDARANAFATGTLGALNFTIRGIENLPGRKSIVLLSDGFRLYDRDMRGMPTSSILADPLRRMIDQATRANVVIYSIDARGMETPGLRADDDVDPRAVSAYNIQRENQIIDTQAGLKYLADQTGGFAHLTNDINKGLERIIDDQSYYLVGYIPNEDTFDANTNKYNKLEIKVRRDGANVRYRSGFYGISDEQLARTKPAGQQAVVNSLLSPFTVNDISLRLHTLFSTDDKKGLWVKSYLHIDAKDLRFVDGKDGAKKAEFDITAVSFGDNGTVADSLSRKYSMTLSADGYKNGLESGIVYEFAFPVKKAGPYQYRVALRDVTTNKIGSASEFIEVPDLRNGRLTLSGVVLEGLSKREWQQKQSSGPNAVSNPHDRVSDTVLRRFKQGEVLRYGIDIYNAKRKDNGSGLAARMRIFGGGKLQFEGKVTPVPVTRSSETINFVGGMNIGQDFAPGEYIMQIVVTDQAGKDQGKAASQFVQFEILE